MIYFQSNQLIIAAVSLLSGAAFCFIILRYRHSSNLNNITTKATAEKQILEERIELRNQHLLDTKELIAEMETKLAHNNSSISNLTDDLTSSRIRIKELETKLTDYTAHNSAQIEIINNSKEELSKTFKALSADIMKSNNQSFLMLAKQSLSTLHQKNQNEQEKQAIAIQELFKPVQTSLQKVDSHMQLIEKNRIETFSSLTEQIKNMNSSQVKLQQETSSLARSLRTPSVRGRWGEIQLRRVVELAGMLEYCDFIQQESLKTEHGHLRPDMTINLPNNKQIVVDSKAILQAYLEANDSKCEQEREVKLKQHAKHVRTHIAQLSAKSYWDQFQNSPEFVVLFLPGENFFSAALEQDPEIIELGVAKKVILATPTTLISLLRAVSFGWRQESLSENAQKIGELGKNLFERLLILSDHFADIKNGLDKTVLSFNKAIGSYESRVMVSARKFTDLDPMLTKNTEPLTAVELTPRQPIEN